MLAYHSKPQPQTGTLSPSGIRNLLNPPAHMSCSLNFLKWLYWGFSQGTTKGATKGDTRSLDESTYKLTSTLVSHISVFLKKLEFQIQNDVPKP